MDGRKLKEQYLTYLDFSLDKALSEPVREGINALFVLRNVLAHGTALIHPVTPMDEKHEGPVPVQLAEAPTTCEGVSSKDLRARRDLTIFAEFELPKHFIDLTKVAFGELESSLASISPRAARTISLVKGYSFGLNVTRIEHNNCTSADRLLVSRRYRSVCPVCGRLCRR